MLWNKNNKMKNLKFSPQKTFNSKVNCPIIVIMHKDSCYSSSVHGSVQEGLFTTFSNLGLKDYIQGERLVSFGIVLRLTNNTRIKNRCSKFSEWNYTVLFLWHFTLMSRYLYLSNVTQLKNAEKMWWLKFRLYNVTEQTITWSNALCLFSLIPNQNLST